MSGINDVAIDRALACGRQAKFTDSANEVYQIAAEALSLCKMSHELPRIVVFGEQSMGKSTLVDSLLGGPIGHVSSEIGTKRPIQIIMNPSKDGATHVSVDDGSTCGSRVSTSTSENSRPAESRYGIGGPVELKSLADLGPHLSKLMTETKEISSKEITVKISAPNAPSLVLVDLPGIKSDDEGDASATKQLVRTYVAQNPNNLYILVKKSCNDPGTWHHTLKDFVLASVENGGLGLNPDQTIVVGTRTLQFLQEIRKEIPQISELHKRALQRGIPTANRGQPTRPFPLYLVELFQLTADERSSTDYDLKKSTMQKQLKDGNSRCLKELEAFGKDSYDKYKELLRMCDFNVLVKDLQDKLNDLVIRKMEESKKKITNDKNAVITKQVLLKSQMAQTRMDNVTEDMRSFIANISSYVEVLATGSMGMTNAVGQSFARTHGAPLLADLKAGHELALKLVETYDTKIDLEYPSNFLTDALELSHRTAESIWKRNCELESHAQKAYCELPTLDANGKKSMDACARELKSAIGGPCPSIYNRFAKGQLVRYCSENLDDHTGRAVIMVGYLTGRVTNELKASDATTPFENRVLGMAEWCAMPSDESSCWWSKTRPKERDQDLIIPIVPLICLNHIEVQSPGILGWRLVHGEWMSLSPVLITAISRNAKEVVSPFPSRTGTCAYVKGGTAKVLRLEVLDREVLRRDVLPDSLQRNECGKSSFKIVGDACEVELDQLFIDHVVESTLDLAKPPTMDIIGGLHASRLVANHLSFNSICIWLANILKSLALNVEVDQDVVAQQTQKIAGISFSALVEPSLTMVVNSHVSQMIYPLLTLAVCAAGSASLRIMKAGFARSMQRVPTKLAYLVESSKFTNAISEALENYSGFLMHKCQIEVIDAVGDACANINFDAPESVFDMCTWFEQRYFSKLDTIGHFAESSKLAEFKIDACNKIQEKRLEVYGQGPAPDKILAACDACFWVTKLQLSWTTPQKILNTFGELGMASTSPHSASSPLSILRKDRRIDDLKTFVENCVINSVVGEPNAEEQCSLLVSEYDLKIPDFRQTIESLERQKQLLECCETVIERLKDVMKSNKLSFLQSSV